MFETLLLAGASALAVLATPANTASLVILGTTSGSAKYPVGKPAPMESLWQARMASLAVPMLADAA